MNRETKILMVSLIMIISLFSAQAVKDSFQAVSLNSEIPICIGSVFEDTITVTNTGSAPTTFTVSADDKYAGWTTIVPAVFTLGPYENRVIHALIRPPATTHPGSYSLTIYISTNMGLEKELKQTITLSRCLNTAVSIDNYSYSNCPCTPTQYVFELGNTGDYTEIYDLSVDAEPDYYTISPNLVILTPGQTVPVYVYMNLPCDKFGDFTFDFVTYSRTSRFRTSTPFYLNLRQSCYDYNISPGMQVQTYVNESINLTIKQAESSYYDLCSGGFYLIPFEIDNMGEISNSFDMAVNAPDFVTLSTDAVFIPSKAKAVPFLTVNTIEEGDFNISVTTIAGRGLISKQLDMQLNIADCRGGKNATLPVNITGNITTGNITENITGQPQPAKIAGILEITLYVVLAVIAALLILLFVLYFIRKYRKAGKKEPEIMKVEENERPEMEKKVCKKWIFWILALLTLAIIGYFLFKWIFGWYFEWELSALSWTGGFFRLYWPFVLIAIVITLLIVLYLLYWPKVKNRFSKEKKVLEKRKPGRPAQKKPIWQFVIVISIVVLFLLLLLCYFTGLCGNLIVYYEPKNATAVGNISNATSAPKENITQEKPLVESATVYIWNKNKIKKIDLVDFVNDTDNDMLNFSATPVENITINISDKGIIKLVPDKDWYGQRVITFIADDGKGGRAYSPDITLVVRNKESFPSLGFFRNIIDQYLYFFILLLVLAALIVIFLVLHVKSRAKGNKKIIVRRKKKQ